uniref:Putative secreted peptide n=1 Tax=Anopheles braziliensis TaxID=58242 RepID=A0A2M3ZV71_9DIPT
MPSNFLTWPVLPTLPSCTSTTWIFTTWTIPGTGPCRVCNCSICRGTPSLHRTFIWICSAVCPSWRCFCYATACSLR